MKHTPGPWQIINESNDAIIRYSDGTLVSFVARIYDATLCEEHGTVEANARLIAAAPELLEALTLAVATIERLEVKHNGFSNVAGTLDVARAALNKAKGE